MYLLCHLIVTKYDTVSFITFCISVANVIKSSRLDLATATGSHNAIPCGTIFRSTRFNALRRNDYYSDNT